MLAVVFGGTHGLDARAGAILWHQPEVTSISSLIPARIRNVDVICNKAGQVLRASDGNLLWSNPHMREGDTGWAAPVVIDEVMWMDRQRAGETQSSVPAPLPAVIPDTD